MDEGFLETAANEVVAATRKRYPKLHIPFHSRWRHFEAGDVNRMEELDRLLGHLNPTERTRACSSSCTPATSRST